MLELHVFKALSSVFWHYLYYYVYLSISIHFLFYLCLGLQQLHCVYKLVANIVHLSVGKPEFFPLIVTACYYLRSKSGACKSNKTTVLHSFLQIYAVFCSRDCFHRAPQGSSCSLNTCWSLRTFHSVSSLFHFAAIVFINYLHK